MIDMNIYECPISEQIGAMKTMMANEHDRMIVKAVQQIGIEIDQESLVQAIRGDRQRYEEAYKKGYADCEEHYKEEQESIEPVCKILFDIPYYFCGQCNEMLNMYSTMAMFCSKCGRPVKWGVVKE